MEDSDMVIAVGSTISIARRLCDAATEGSVDKLDGLVQHHGKVILSGFSQTPLSETPLHLAALLGHTSFVKRLLQLRPDLAYAQDSENCTPLHLAAANGHDQVVRGLLEVDSKANLMQDQEGRLPLHLAAMRGHAAVARELLKSTQPAEELLTINTIDGDGVLHLCIKYNHLDVLKVVVEEIGGDSKILTWTDSCGNTVLQLAVMLKQIETVRFLLELPRVRTGTDNFTPWDYKSLVIREILVAGSGAETVWPSHQGGGDEGMEAGGGNGYWNLARKGIQLLRCYKGDWMNDSRGWLVVVTTLIASVTFAAAISPPGGVWSQDAKNYSDNCDRNEDICSYICGSDTENMCWAGSAVLSFYYIDHFIGFMKYNTISFISSLMVVFLLLSGFPLNHKFTLWILSLAMSFTVSFLGLTFLEVMWLVLPYHLIPQYNTFKKVSKAVWFTMVGLVGICLLIRLSYWVKRHNLNKLIRPLRSSKNNQIRAAGRMGTNSKQHTHA